MASQTEIAEHLGLNKRTVQELLPKLGLPTRDCPIDQARLVYLDHLRAVASGHKSDDGYDLTKERARLSHHQANCEELKERQLIGELIPAEEVKAQWSDMILAVRAKILSLPGKVASIAMAAESLREVEEFVSEELHGALNELVEDDTPGSPGPAKATPKTNRKRVGSQASAAIT